jgi:hypothetical protein
MAKAVLSTKAAGKTKNIKSKTYPITKIVPGQRIVRINDILPFRVRFTSVIIEGVTGNNVPPIPLQIIGFSNYIL